MKIIEYKSIFSDYKNVDEKGEKSVSTKRFQNCQFLRSYKERTLTFYYSLLNLIVGILQQCHLWIQFIGKLKQFLFPRKIRMMNLLKVSIEKFLVMNIQKIQQLLQEYSKKKFFFLRKGDCTTRTC